MPRAQLTPHAVIEAALDLADRDGFASVTVSALARSVGVQPASLYEHIAGRDALWDGMHRAALAELATAMGDAIAGRSQRDALLALADAQRDYATKRPGAWAAMQRPASAETARSGEASRVASLTLAVLRGYDIDDTELVHATRFVAAAIGGFLALTTAQSFAHRDESIDASWLATLEAAHRALASWPSTGALR